MHSLTQLNVYSGSGFDYADQRDPGIKLSNVPPVNQSISSIEGYTHELPIGTDILAIYNYATANVVYSVNTAAVANTTITWDTLPSGMHSANSSGIYSVWPINNSSDWEAIKSPTITMPTGYNGTFVYTANIAYTDSNANVQSTGWTIVDIVTPGTDLSLAEDYYFDTTSAHLMSGVPTIISANTAPVYTITITPSDANVVTTLSSAGTGGTSSFNGTSKVLTIVGTKTQVNSHLASVTLTPASLSTCVFTYHLTNNANAGTSTRLQDAVGNNGLYLSLKDSDSYYNEDQPRAISGAPHITDAGADGSGTYTLTIKTSAPSYTANIATAGTGGTTSWNNTTKILTLTGTRTQVNSHLSAITFWAQIDYTSPIILTYSLVTPSAHTGVSTQVLYVDVIDIEVTNMTYDRNYISNSSNLIFATDTPQIDDATANTQVYSISLSTSMGVFTSDNTTYTSTWSYTGTKSQINALFPLIKFYPNKDVSTSGTFTYTQIKNGNTQVIQAVTLIGTARTTPIDGVGFHSYTSSQSLTITYEQARYLRANIALIGGGGAAGSFAYGPGGGGGAGEVTILTNQTLNTGTYQLIIGSGGSGAATGSPRIPGLSGEDTIINYGITQFSIAHGGQGGGFISDPLRTDLAPHKGGTSGGGYTGGDGLTPPSPYDPTSNAMYAAGGGGGSSANGQSAYLASSTNLHGGNGGAGRNLSSYNLSPGYNVATGGGGAGGGLFNGTSWTYGTDGTPTVANPKRVGDGGRSARTTYSDGGAAGAVYIYFY